MLLWSSFAASQTIVEYAMDHIISNNYIGNGAQWDPYQLDYGHGKMQMVEAEWQKIYKRLDFMRPQLMRVVHNTAELMTTGKLDPSENIDQVTHILNYCQKNNITVIFGDWGWGLADAKANTYDKKKIEMAADYVTFLVKEKGYSCIKYYNMINEPNGFWSTTEGNYDLWRDITLCFYNRLKKNRMLSHIKLVGADLAIWTPAEVDWQEKASKDINLGLYDIHTYPSKVTVNSGQYGEICKAYKDAVPQGKQIVMGEIGLKFVEPTDSLYQQENLRRAAALPYASMDDSQMFIFDYMYGTDMADVLMQTANVGYAGCVAWMLDDAMHSAEAPDKLKMWGFWNILGDEFFGSEQENIRPWYYAWSLLCRYMPQGCSIYETKIKGNPNIKALAVKKDGKTMLAVLNVLKRPQKVTLQGKTNLASCSSANDEPGEKKAPDASAVNTLSIADKEATAETKALYANLWVVQQTGFMFGHHDDLTYGRYWQYEDGNSDTKQVCGDYPAVYSVDLAEVMDNRAETQAEVNAIRKRCIEQAYNRGMVVVACMHLNNPLTGGDAWDNSSNQVAKQILTNGSPTQTIYNSWLNNLVAFAHGLKGNDGKLIPIIFRPFHEHTQSWSWWGNQCTTEAKFVALWRYTVDYLRQAGAHQFIYAISPQMDTPKTMNDFTYRWPGDDYVDFIGMDCYNNGVATTMSTNIDRKSVV